MRTLLSEFRTFASSGSLPDVAIGIATGAASATVVQSLVDDVVLRLVAALSGQPSLASVVPLGQGEIALGQFLTDPLSFLLLALVVLVLVEAVEQATGKEAAGAQGDRECDHCTSSIPVDASVCTSCTRDVEPLVA